MSRFFDSNILLYLLEPGNPKAAMARALVDGGGVISTQVLNEFIDVARRKHRLALPEILEVLEPIKDGCIAVPLDLAVHERAVAISGATNLRIFDACIVAAADLSGCNVLFTEDLNDGQRIGGVTIRNPFLAAA